MTDARNKFPDPTDLLKVFEGWWRTGSVVTATIATALVALNIDSSVAYVVAIPIAVLGLGIAVILYRKDARRRARDVAVDGDARRDLQGPPGAAFRGLRRFLRGESLPGPQRRRDAALLSRKVVHPDFRIALVTGDSGAGKSSLLECALVEGLEAAGHSVVLISDTSRLVAGGLTGSVRSTPIRTVLEAIAAEVSRRRVEGAKSVVLILDQFEELLSRFRAKEDRHTLGDALQEMLTAGTRVVIGIRKEHLIDFRDIATRLSHPVSFEDTFLVENFDVTEAATVIRECARRDAAIPDLELPELIAGDLAEAGKVRPADLQIVCTALSGDLTVERYRSEGKASGLRSRFIKAVMDIIGDTVLARAVLRELCDIPNSKKAPEPLSAEAIAEKARAGAPGERATTEAVRSVLLALEQARVAVVADANAGQRWSLIHDYLVDPIRLATEEQTARSEVAAARLDHFVVRAQAAAGVTIPLQELRSIRRDAPPAALRRPAARRLVRRSLWIGYGTPVGVATAAALAAITIVMVAATEQHWAKGVPYVWADFPYRWLNLEAHVTEFHGQPNRLAVVTMVRLSGDRRQVNTWDGRTGDLLSDLSFPLSPKGTEVQVVDGRLWRYDETIGRLTCRDFYGSEVWSVDTSQDGRPDGPLRVVRFDPPIVLLVTAETQKQPSRPVALNISTKGWRNLPLHELLGIPQVDADALPYRSIDLRVSTRVWAALATGSRLDRRSVSRLTVWTPGYQALVLSERFDDTAWLAGLTDFGTHTAVTVGRGDVFENIIIKHSTGAAGIGAGFVVGTRDQIPLPNEMHRRYRIDADHGPLDMKTRLVFLSSRKPQSVLWAFNPNEARFEGPHVTPYSAVLRGGFRHRSLGSRGDNAQGYAWVPDGTSGSAKIWLTGQAAPIHVEGLRITAGHELSVSNDHLRLLVSPSDGVGELWGVDAASGKASQLKRLEARNGGRFAFSDDGNLVLLRRPLGEHLVWGRDGQYLGNLGVIGGDVFAATYHVDCRQALLWTADGARLVITRGFRIPLYGFLPERSCSAQKSWGRRVIEPAIDYFAR